MKNRFTFVLLALAATALTISSCKKEATTPEVYFSAPSASTSRGGQPVVVNIELSEASDEIVELFVESIGDDHFTLGSINQKYVHDDSSKCEALIDVQAVIDSPGHIKLSRGVKSVSISFTPLFDHFPHAAANFKIRIASAINANVRQGSNEFALNIADAELINAFDSEISYSGFEYNDSIETNAAFTMESFTYSANGNGTYKLNLVYNKNAASTASALQKMFISYDVFPAIVDGVNTYFCGTTPPSISFEPNNVVEAADCSSLDSASIVINGQDKFSVYGKYNTFTSNVTIQDSSNFFLSGSINSVFLLNQ